MRLQMDTERRDIIPEEKQLSNQWWINLWQLPGKDKKIWSREVTAEIKCGKRIRYI